MALIPLCVFSALIQSLSSTAQATLIQEKFEGGLYLESGVRIGAGNMFYPLRDNDIQKSMRSLDTVYILQADLGQVTA